MNYDEKMAEFAEVTQQIKELKAKKEELRTDLLIALKTDEITETESDTHRLAFTISKRRTFEKDKALDFLQKHDENLDDYYLESEYETLKIKAKIKQIEADE